VGSDTLGLHDGTNVGEEVRGDADGELEGLDTDGELEGFDTDGDEDGFDTDGDTDGEDIEGDFVVIRSGEHHIEHLIPDHVFTSVNH